jgi:hypothetical protein
MKEASMPQAPGDDIRSILVSAQQRRQIRSPRIAFSDRRFFERFPHRQHRVRLASREEIDHWGELLPQGFELCTAVRNVAPGARLRMFLPAPLGRETDVDEVMARVVYETAAPPHIWDAEAQLRKLMRECPGGVP